MTRLQDLLPSFQTVGCDLYRGRMVSVHGGNLSVKLGNNLCITRRGSRLGCLALSDLVETGVDKDDVNTTLASSELAVHRAIYRQTEASAVIHAHPTYTVVLSFAAEKIKPLDIEGRLLLKEIPVVGFGQEPMPGEYAPEISQALKQFPIAVVYGHGSFARGAALSEAYTITAMLEESCCILYMRMMLNLKL